MQVSQPAAFMIAARILTSPRWWRCSSSSWRTAGQSSW